MQETCQLTFRTSRGRNRVVSVNDPRAGINEQAVTAAANMMISADPFDAETGSLVKLVRAQLVTVSRQAIIAPPEVA
ncbi:MAG: DUF2922 domain-containing protein [Defluviitaleaceae bacterium]|nr:DUF2922 domain-containing protein [Defluviitaleaceae bacterium]MCL2239753.1 DUF2922 domain-containing protein [Defluviitaleaceae bacterium]